MNCYLLFVTFGILLSGCDPGVSYERIVENNTSHDIWIKKTGNLFPEFEQDSVSIPKNSEQVISIYSGLGHTFEFENCGVPDNTILGGIIYNDTLQIAKDLNTESNWIFSVLEQTFKQGGECECRLKLTDADIQ